MHLAIIGSRDYPGSPETVATAIAQHSLAPTAVLCGEARGPDTWGRLWAEQQGIPVISYPADWERYGRSAGMIRNREMIGASDAVLALWDGKSKGTGQAIKIARRWGISVYLAGETVLVGETVAEQLSLGV